MKRGGFNLIDIKEEDKSIDKILGEGMSFKEERPRKKKINVNFDNILPLVKQKNMGMDLNETSMFGKCEL